LLMPAETRAQAIGIDHSDDWDSKAAEPHMFRPPDWGMELALSLYRPDIDGELSNGKHPYADTFGSGRHPLWEVEVDRYLVHGVGTFGVGLRVGFYKVTAAAVLSDGSASGDQTWLQLIPFSLSALYKADGLPGLRVVPIIPYAKLGLDGVSWRTSDESGAPTLAGFSTGWHAAAGLMLGLNSLGGNGIVIPGTLADPGALFFEWDYSAINGLGLSHALHVGDNTWYAGLMFDL